MPWSRIGGLALAQLIAWGILFYAFAVIVEPMGVETGWTKPQMHGAQSLGLLVSGLSAYGVGRWIDRHGGRGLMILGAGVGAAAVVLWSQISELWQLYLVCVMIGAASAMSLYEAAFAVTARLVPDQYRQAITAITLLGGLASTVFIPLTHWLVEGFGWRISLLSLAAILLVSCTAIPIVSLPRGQRAIAALVSGDRRPSVFPVVKRQPVFWLLLASYVCFAFFYSSLLFNLLPILSENGFSVAAAVGIYAMIGPFQVSGRLGMFLAGRSMSIGLAGLVGTVLPILAMIALLAAEPGSIAAFVFPALFGAGMGIKTIVQATAAPSFLGIKEYGALQGLLTMPVLIVQAASPFAAAVLWHWTGNSHALMYALLICAMASAIAFGLAAWTASHRAFATT